MRRRQFLKAACATLALSGCRTEPNTNQSATTLGEPTAAQIAKKKQGNSTVGIIKCISYEQNLLSLIKSNLSALELPDLTGKKVVIKPNMVECHPGKPIWTDPRIVEAAVELADYLGAREVVVAEGAGHMRDTEYLLNGTGIGKTLKRLGIKFVDLNLDDLELVPNPDSFSGLDHFYLPRTIVEADAVVSVPKMKTHHWVQLTASMKNLFGTVPGRHYGWPKNLLHVRGIPNCIIDLVHLVRPKLAFVDAIISMEGDGPINGTAKHTGFIILGTDLAAVDATCARTMEMDFNKIGYLRCAGQVIGNIDAEHIKVIGAQTSEVAQNFQKPKTYYHPELMHSAGSSAS